MHYLKRIYIMFRNTRRRAMATVLPLVALLQGCQQQRCNLDEETHMPQGIVQECPLLHPDILLRTGNVSTTDTILTSTQLTDDRTIREHDLTTRLFTSRSGRQMKFAPVANQWYAMICATPDNYLPQRTLPVVAPPDIGGFLATLHDQDLNAEKARIHIVDTPSKSCVYLGKYGLAGGSKKKKSKKQGNSSQAVPAPVAEDTPEIVRQKENLERQEGALARSRQLHKNQPHSELAALVYDVGMAHVTSGNLNKGLVFFEQALEMYQVLYLEDEGVLRNLIRVLSSLGSIHISLGKSHEGLGYKEQAIELCRELDQPYLYLANLLDDVGAEYYTIGKFRKAVMYGERALDTKRALYKHQPHPELITTLNILGQAYNALREFSKELRCSTEALTLNHIFYKDHPNLARSLYNVGLSHYSLIEYGQASECFEQALAMRRVLYKEPAHPEIADSLESIGMVAYALHDYRKAFEYFEQALVMQKMLHEGRSYPGIADLLESIGMSCNSLRDHHKAIEYFEQVLTVRKELYKENPHPKLADAFNNMGVVYESLSEFYKSAEYF